MPEVIRNRRVEDDARQIVRLAEGETPETVNIPDGPVLVPLTVWQARADVLAARGDVGVWLDAGEGAETIAADLPRLAAVAINFPAFTDGRGYSTAALLRTRHGYAGELRAIGDVLRDQFQAYIRCGFDTLQPPVGRYSRAQLEAALASLGDFSVPYQGAVDEPRPLWARAERGIAA